MLKVLLIVLFAVNFYAFDCYAIGAKSAVLIDALSGRVLYEQNAEQKLPMASTTKIMTGLLACESNKLDNLVKISPFASGTEGSSLWLKIGEKQSLENLTYGLMLKSGNDAAVAIGEYLSGSIDAFALLMNKRAREIGAVNTNFENPHGLDSEKHYTTAYDLAIITREAMKNSKFRQIVSTKTYSIPMEGEAWDRVLKNHNKLLWRYDGCNGVKTGFTKKSGRCLVSYAKRGKEEYICVTLNSPNDWNEHIELLDYGFNNYEVSNVTKKGEIMKEICFDKKYKRKVKIEYADNFSVALKVGEKLMLKNEYTKLTPPLKKGSYAGKAEIICNDVIVGEINLVTARSIKELSIIDRIKMRLVDFLDKITV